MEINYNTILRYLNPEYNLNADPNDSMKLFSSKNEQLKERNSNNMNDQNGMIQNESLQCKTMVSNSGSSCKNIMKDLNNLPTNILDNLLKSNSKFYRIGVTKSNKKIYDKEYNKNCDLSFFTSILTAIDKNYISLDENEEINFLISFIDKIKENILDNKFKFELKYKFPKTVLMNRIQNLNFRDGLIYQVLIQLLDINLLIFEEKDDDKGFDVLTSFPEYTLNPWKPIILLYKKDNSFEPIMNDTSKVFSYNNNFIKDLLVENYSNIKYLYGNYLDKDFSLNDDLNAIIEEFILDNKIDSDHIKSKGICSSSLEENKENSTNDIDSNSTFCVNNTPNDTLLTTGLLIKSEIEKDSDDESNHNETKDSYSDHSEENVTSEANTDKKEEFKFYNKTNLTKMKRDEIIKLISENKKIFSTFTKVKSLTKNELIQKFLFFQNIFKNQNSVKSSSS